MTFTLFGFSAIVCLAVHRATCENGDRSTRYITDPEFGNVEDVKSSAQNSDATLFGEPESFGNQNGGAGNYFMDVYSVQTGPKQIEFGHVFEDPDMWEQRYERKDHDKKRFQGKARWGDKHGGYGEQYWDYNHGGDAHEEGSSNEEIIDPSQTQTAKTLTSYSPLPSIDPRGPQTSETHNHKSEHKENKKYKKSSKLKHDDARLKKTPEVTEVPYSTEKPDLYQDIPKLKIRPTYERDFSPVEGKKAQQYQNVNLYSQSDHFPIMYDTPKKHQRANYDHIQSLRSYEQRNDGYTM